MSKRAWVGLGAAALVVTLAGGGYALLMSSANDAVERSFAQFRASLPPGAVFTHGPYEVDLLERSVVVASPAIDFNGHQGLGIATAERLTIAGLEPGETETHAAQVLLDSVSLTGPQQTRGVLTIEVIEARDLVISGQPAGLQAAVTATKLASLRATGFELAAEEADFALGELVATGLDGGRLQQIEFRDLTIESLEPLNPGSLTVGLFSLAGLDFSPLLALPAGHFAALSEEEAFERGFVVAQQITSRLKGYAVERARLETERLPGPLELGLFRLTDPQIVGDFVVGGVSELEGLSIPFDPAVSVFAGRIWSRLDLEERLLISGRGDQRYDPETSSISLQQDVTLHDMLELQLTLRLGNLAEPLHPGMSEAEFQVALLGATLGAAELTLIDLGLLRPALEVFAADAGQTPEQLVGQLVTDGAEAVRALRIGPVGLEALEAAESFLLEPGRFQVALTPEEEVPLLLLGVADSPGDAVDLLNPSFSAVPN